MSQALPCLSPRSPLSAQGHGHCLPLRLDLHSPPLWSLRASPASSPHYYLNHCRPHQCLSSDWTFGELLHISWPSSQHRAVNYVCVMARATIPNVPEALCPVAAAGSPHLCLGVGSLPLLFTHNQALLGRTCLTCLLSTSPPSYLLPM